MTVTDPAPGATRDDAAAPPTRRSAGLPAVLWGVATVAVAAALGAGIAVGFPAPAERVLAVALAALYALALTHRLGGRPLLPLLLTVGYGAVAVGTRAPALLAGAATGMSVLAAALALMITTPAARFRYAVREVILAAAVATVGGLGVRGAGTGIDETRFGYVVLGVTLLSGFAMVYRLGAGFHGVGRRGYAVAALATVLVALGLVYSAAFGRWGSPAIVDHLDQVRHAARSHLHAVPHPIEAILGIPALCWGTFMRARRRQGWWVCAFGAAVTAPSTTRFVVTGVPTATALLSIGYTLVIGFVVAYVVIRLDQVFTGNRGRRARRHEEADAHRPEPGRFQPLR